MGDKKADLAGPGIGTYEEVEKSLPTNYKPLLNPKETQIALFEVKKYIEENLGKELNLIRVESPLIVDRDSGMNDYLDRDGSRTLAGRHTGGHRAREGRDHAARPARCLRGSPAAAEPVGPRRSPRRRAPSDRA